MPRFPGNTYALTAFLTLTTLAACDSNSPFSSEPWPPPGTLPPVADALTPILHPHPTVIVASAVIGDSLWVADDTDLFHSENGGADWRVVRQGAIVGLAVNADESKVFALGHDGVLYRTTDRGKHWQRRNIGPQLKRLQDVVSDYPFNAQTLHASADASQLIVVGDCDAFRSHDGGISWALIPGRGGWDEEYHCLNGLVLDADLQPQTAAVDITGTLAAGIYVFERRGELWAKRCSFDLVAYMLNSVTNCNELPEFADDYALKHLSDDISLELINDVDPDQAIFRNAQLPITNLPRDRHWPNLLVDDAHNRLWWISYYGVALSESMGESWQTMVGGIPQREPALPYKDGLEVALYKGQIYARNDRIWRSISMPEEVYQLRVTSAGLLSLSVEGLWLLPELSAPAQRVFDGGSFDALEQHESLIWGLSDKLTVSTDGGQHWLQADRELEGMEWQCDSECLRVDWQGVVWRAALQDGELRLQEQGRIDMPASQSISNQWFTPGDGLWLVATMDDDAEDDSDSRYLLSTDRGAHWQPITLQSEIDETLGLGSGQALVTTYGGRVLLFDAALPERYREALRLPAEAWGLCARDDGALMVMVEGSHPDYPEVADFLIYSTDKGNSWYTQASTNGAEHCER